MPTIFTQDGFRFFFYSNENAEPMHVHVEKGDGVAKFWLAPLSLAMAEGFSPRNLKRIREIIVKRQVEILERWHEHFGR